MPWARATVEARGFEVGTALNLQVGQEAHRLAEQVDFVWVVVPTGFASLLQGIVERARAKVFLEVGAFVVAHAEDFRCRKPMPLKVTREVDEGAVFGDVVSPHADSRVAALVCEAEVSAV